MSAEERANAAAGRWGYSINAAELWAIGLSVLSLVLLYAAVAPEMASGKPESQYALVFLPHLVLAALIVGGMRRLAVLAQTFITLFAALVGLGMCIDSAMGNHELHGYGLIVAVQLPLFVLCYRSARSPFRYQDLSALGPRLMLGVFLGVIGWFASGLAMHAAAAPARERAAAELAVKQREWAQRDAQARAEVLTACLQQSPATADSQPYFPATLAELPNASCPEARMPAPPGFVIDYAAGPADSAGLRRTFRLAIHDSEPSDTARTIAASESMLVRSWHGEGARRFPTSIEQPLELLGRVGRCIEQARDTVGLNGLVRYPASVAEARLKGRCEAGITADSAAFRERTAHGYYFVRYTPPAALRLANRPGGFTLLLEPGRDSLGRGLGGDLLSFFSDTDGVIHMSRRPRAATAADSVIPDCAIFEYGRRDAAVQCREFRPRQRWGLSSELPTIAMSMSGTGTLGIGEQLSLLPHFQPLLPQDLPTEVRVRWDSGGRDTVLTKRRGAPFGTPIGNGLYFTFRHAWADTGMKRVEVRIRTAGGETFESHQDIHVVPVH